MPSCLILMLIIKRLDRSRNYIFNLGAWILSPCQYQIHATSLPLVIPSIFFGHTPPHLPQQPSYVHRPFRETVSSITYPVEDEKVRDFHILFIMCIKYLSLSSIWTDPRWKIHICNTFYWSAFPPLLICNLWKPPKGKSLWDHLQLSPFGPSASKLPIILPLRVSRMARRRDDWKALLLLPPSHLMNTITQALKFHWKKWVDIIIGSIGHIS